VGLPGAAAGYDMVLRTLGLLVSVFLGACAPMTVAPIQSQAIKRVAVISAVGDTFTVKKIGITVFGNEQKEFPIEPWGVDEFVVNKLRGVLSARFDVRPMAYQRSAFNAGSGTQAIADVVRVQSRSQDIDAYIVVSKGSAHYRNSNQNVYGLGVVERAGLGDSAVHLHAIYWMTVVDGHSYSVMASAPAVPLGQTLLSVTDAIGGLSRQIDKSWIPDSVDPVQNAKLKGAVLELLDQNLPGTLQNLKIME
jgi:hypothetical protein